MKYITILEEENSSNVGTMTTDGIDEKFKEAIEAHFDARLISFSFVESYIKSFSDCINACPIDVLVKLDTDGDSSEHRVELSETWLY